MLLRNLRRDLKRELETIKLELARTEDSIAENERIKQEFSALVKTHEETKESRRLERAQLEGALAHNENELRELTRQAEETSDKPMSDKERIRQQEAFQKVIDARGEANKRLAEIKDLTFEDLEAFVKANPINVHEPVRGFGVRSCIRKLGHGQPTGGLHPRVLAEEPA